MASVVLPITTKEDFVMKIAKLILLLITIFCLLPVLSFGADCGRCQVSIGNDCFGCYELGQECTNDRCPAANYPDWLKSEFLLAAKNNGNAQARIGEYYLTGRGLPLSSQEALLWLKKAANNGSQKAKCLLGSMYAQGNGVARNISEARNWYKSGAATSPLGVGGYNSCSDLNCLRDLCEQDAARRRSGN
jgi:hypothetical protein